MIFFSGDALQEAVEWNLRPGVGGGRTSWPASQDLANYRLIKSVTASRTPINTPPLPMEFNTPHSSCSSRLVKVLI
jgi:hypothetical protein